MRVVVVGITSVFQTVSIYNLFFSGIKLLKVILLLTRAVKTSSNYNDIDAIKKVSTVLHCCRTTMSCTEGTVTRQTRLVSLR